MGAFVKNGTPLHGPPLCETCAHAHIERGFCESDELVICQITYPEHRVLFRVRQCTGFTETKRQTLEQMERIAWVVSSEGYSRKVGFDRARRDEMEKPGIVITLGNQE